MVAEEINNPHGFGLFNHLRAYALAHQLKCPGKWDSAFLSVASGGAIIDAGRQAVQLSVGKRGRLPDVVVAAAKTGVVLGEELQERYR